MDKTDNKKITWTVDVDGGDFGWRTGTQQGIEEGMPRIIDLFNKYKIIPIVFVAPQFFHLYKYDYLGLHIKDELPDFKLPKYVRGHKFWKFPNWQNYLPYSSPKNHTSLLRHMWLKEPIRDIFYFHPFDIVRPKTKPPNLFCKFWYSQPERAYRLLEDIVSSS
jgi:hypothetical protein